MPDLSTASPSTWQTIGILLVFVLGIYVSVFLVRRLFEGVFKRLGQNYYWKEVAMPMLPPLLGAIIATSAKLYPFPEVISTTSSRIMFGLVCGFFSGLIYRVCWAILKKYLAGKGIDVTGLSSPPPNKTFPPQTSVTNIRVDASAAPTTIVLEAPTPTIPPVVLPPRS